MKSTQIMTRVYRDGIVGEKHTGKKREFTVEYPRYTLFRHEIEEWDRHSIPTQYSIVADYGNGQYGNWIIEDVRVAFNTFRMMCGVKSI